MTRSLSERLLQIDEQIADAEQKVTEQALHYALNMDDEKARAASLSILKTYEGILVELMLFRRSLEDYAASSHQDTHDAHRPLSEISDR